MKISEQLLSSISAIEVNCETVYTMSRDGPLTTHDYSIVINGLLTTHDYSIVINCASEYASLKIKDRGTGKRKVVSQVAQRIQDFLNLDILDMGSAKADDLASR